MQSNDERVNSTESESLTVNISSLDTSLRSNKQIWLDKILIKLRPTNEGSEMQQRQSFDDNRAYLSPSIAYELCDYYALSKCFRVDRLDINLLINAR